MKFIQMWLIALVLSLTTVSYANSQYVFVSDYAENSGIARMALDGSGFERILTDTDSYYGYVGGIAVDNANDMLYYVGNFKIKRCKFDGSDVQTLFKTVNEPGDLLICNNKMYYTEGAAVKRANMDGSNRETVVSNLAGCFSLAYDNNHDKLYYVGYEDQTWNKGSIFRSDPDGKNIEKLVNNVGLVAGITVDSYSNKMYWTSRTEPYNSIKSANLDGTVITDLITCMQNPLVEVVQRLDVDSIGHKLYWTDQAGGGKVQRINFDGTGYEVIHYDGAPYGIAISVPEPSMMFLMCLGGLALRMRRRKTEGLRHFSCKPL